MKIKQMKNLLTAALILASSSVIAAEHEVKMLNNGSEGMMVFDPGYIKVAPGDSVKFIPTDAGHNSASYFTPEGAKSWSSDFSKEFTVKLDKEGVYLYKCVPHEVMAMVGVIQVGNATNKDAATAAAKTENSKFSLNKDRLDKYIANVK